MSDPAHGGYTCCAQPMIRLDWIDAYLCAVGCLKFRHALPVGDPRRHEVVARMEAWTRQEYQRR